MIKYSVHLIILFFFSIAVFGLTGCSSVRSGNVAEGADGAIKYYMTPESREMVEGINKSGLQTFKSICKSDKYQNVIFSPLSESVLKSLESANAGNETRKEVFPSIFGEVKNLSAKDVDRFFASLTSGLETVDSTVILSTANGIWIRPELKLNKHFLETGKKYYNLEMFRRNLSLDTTRLEINQWASEKTRGQISEYLSQPIDTNRNSVLLSTLYFKGKWKRGFLEDEVKFTLENKENIAINALMQFSDYGIPNLAYADSNVCVFDSPIGEGLYTMTFYMPASKDTSIKNFINNLTFHDLTEWRMKCGEGPDVVRIPEFDITSQVYFTESEQKPLNNRMMNRILGQKARVKIDKRGVESAVVTEFMVSSSYYTLNGKTILDFDHPFIFTITEKSTGIILFMGLVRDPR